MTSSCSAQRVLFFSSLVCCPYFLPATIIAWEREVGFSRNVNATPHLDQSAYSLRFHTSKRAPTWRASSIGRLPCDENEVDLAASDKCKYMCRHVYEHRGRSLLEGSARCHKMEPSSHKRHVGGQVETSASGSVLVIMPTSYDMTL